MPVSKILLRPGVNVQETPTLAEGTWSAAQLIRFKDGLPQKLGGWTHLNSQLVVGTGRGLHGWADLSGIPYVAVGTEQRLQVFYENTLFDITPYRATHNVTPNFSTVSSSQVVTVVDTASNANIGDWVNVNVTIAVGGILLQGLYQVASVTDGNTYTIMAGSAATSTVSNGGAAPVFDTTSGVATVNVTLAAHGLSVGGRFDVQVSTTVGGVTMLGSYIVTSVTDAGHFVITPGPLASATATGSENGGNAQFNYLIASGFASTTVGSGYGAGLYGYGLYGLGSRGPGAYILDILRQWFLDNWGQDLIGNYTQGTLYVWVPQSVNAQAITGTGIPLIVHSSFVAMPEQILVALGCDPAPTFAQDPNLIRWSDVADYTQFVASATNQAGSFRIPTGSMIVGGLQGPQYGCIWTDIDFWLMQYLQPPLVFGFNKVAGGVGLLAARGCGVYQSSVYWVSSDNFLVFDGNSVQVIPCTVWDKFFRNLNSMQKDKITCAVNSLFGEVAWYYPSAGGDGEVDSYVKYQIVDRVWDYGTLDRTCWIDESPVGQPIGVDTSGLMQQHETSADADGAPLVSSIQSGYFEIADGTMFTFLERFIPDFILDGGTETVKLSAVVEDFPSDTPTEYGPFSVTPATPYTIVRARGRVAAIKIMSDGLGVFWRLGALRYIGSPAGKR